MEKERMASKSHVLQDDPHYAVTASARPVDMNLPTIDPNQEANLSTESESGREDSILPDNAQGWLDKMGRAARRARGATLSALPASVVNNSSNVIGMVHLGAEALMIKAYAPELTPEQIEEMRRTGQNRFLYDAKKSLTGSAKALPLQMSLGDLLKPSFYKDNLRSLTDLGFAAERDKKLYGNISNRWGSRSVILGMSGMALSAVLPEKQESVEEIEEMAQLRQDNYISYVGTRIGQALNPLGWPSHKRQLAGVGLIGAGFCSFMNGMLCANRSGGYTRNPSHAAAGIITTLAGGMLTLAADNQQGWQDFGKTMSLRMLFLPTSISEKYGYKIFDSDSGKMFVRNSGKAMQGRHWYVGGQAGFRAVDATAYLIGGAEKLPDGTVVDKDAIRRAAELKAKGFDTIFDEENPAPVSKESEKTTEKQSPDSIVAEVKAHERQAEEGRKAAVNA